jgi:neutral ceramidase
MSELKVGCGRRDITPYPEKFGPIDMRGSFSRRPATEVNDPLHARAIYFEGGGDRAALVTLDLIGTPRELMQDVRARLADTLGLEARQVFICATHTHSAPAPGHEDYRDLFVTGICEAVEEAAADAAPAKVSTARRLVYGISFNRRAWQADGTVGMYFGYESQDIVLLDGPIDPVLGVFSFEREDRPRIVLANFSLHACTAGGGMISADYPAAFEDCMREVMREPLHLQFTNAPCGNVNHCDLSQPVSNRPNGILRHETGAALADAAWRGLKDAREIEAGPVRAISKTLSAQTRGYTDEELEAALKVDIYGNSTWGGDFLEATKKLRIKRCADWGPSYDLEVGALRFGEAGLAFMPGEDFVEFAIDIKKRSPLYPHTFAVELAYDDVSYIPTQEAFPQGGYTVYSCRFEPGTGEQMVETALAALKEAAEK